MIKQSLTYHIMLINARAIMKVNGYHMYFVFKQKLIQRNYMEALDIFKNHTVMIFK